MMSFGLLLLACLMVGGVSVVGGQKARIWTVVRGHEWGPHEYIDNEGYIQGFSSEFITLICAEAEMDCRIVWDRYTGCWQSEAGQRPHAGPGLMGRWYDACTGWVQTIERIHTFAFSQSYLKIELSYFYVLKGSPFNPRDLSGKTIGFFDGWATNEQCLARASEITSNILKQQQIIHILGPSQGMEMLESKKVHALFAGGTVFHEELANKLTKIDFPITCFLGGSAMMSRSDSDFPAMWNVGFNKARSNGKFLALCQEANIKHGKVGKINCVDSY